MCGKAAAMKKVMGKKSNIHGSVSPYRASWTMYPATTQTGRRPHSAE